MACISILSKHTAETEYSEGGDILTQKTSVTLLDFFSPNLLETSANHLNSHNVVFIFPQSRLPALVSSLAETHLNQTQCLVVILLLYDKARESKDAFDESKNTDVIILTKPHRACLCIYLCFFTIFKGNLCLFLCCSC